MDIIGVMFLMLIVSALGMAYFSSKEWGVVPVILCAAVAYASIGTITDIDDREDAIRDVAKGSERYQQLVADNPDCFVSIKVIQMEAKMFLKCPVEDV